MAHYSVLLLTVSGLLLCSTTGHSISAEITPEDTAIRISRPAVHVLDRAAAQQAGQIGQGSSPQSSPIYNSPNNGGWVKRATTYAVRDCCGSSRVRLTGRERLERPGCQGQ